jgi:pimeloyl-ACP methyl ester carboxylesterase
VPQKYFYVDGIATFVHHTGPTTLPHVVPDARKGHAILAVHGAAGNGNTYRPLLEKLAAAHSPFAFDLPAHARSGGLDSLPSIARMAEFTRAVAGRLGLRTPVLLGHSMGGMVALEYALRWPDEVRALVLVGSAARSTLPEAHVAQQRRIVAGKARREFSREGFSPAASPEVVRAGIMEELKTDPRAVLGDLLAIQGFDAVPRLRDVRPPTLVLYGEDEMERLRVAGDELAAGIPGARKGVIPKAGHLVPLEQPEAVADAVNAFLGEARA